MKTLYIVRHAKSSWDFPGLLDEERPLLQKGIKRTLKVADFLLEKNIRVDLIISSHAVRAHETAKIIAGALGYPEEKILISIQVYHGSSNQLYDELFKLTDDIKSVMMFGHNPAFSSFANHFLKKKIDWLPTSGIVAINFETDQWTQIPLAKGKTDFVIFPKDL
ncbi:MAG: histidine phosphatase family protein [Bacteroidetes bacterium]|nr:histidine phosphatase family protein [Bacteroidota bacterium]